jgi:hypothetical protein
MHQGKLITNAFLSNFSLELELVHLVFLKLYLILFQRIHLIHQFLKNIKTIVVKILLLLNYLLKLLALLKRLPSLLFLKAFKLYLYSALFFLYHNLDNS